MGDHATFNDPAANAPDAAAYDKGKGKADPAQEVSMDEDESESEDELEVAENDDDGDEGNLEPIDQSNIIQGGRRTRGKVIDYSEAAEKSKNAGDEMEDSDDDEDYQGADDNDDDDQMRD
ncbi:hypothetical protein N7492_009292 [Penicillium capsulatum]|uniref:Histone chaperone domain-containing protein n=1 Tax=Penicillium capsulatum TaxID=69766 RepID=A0A9W9HU87_9EURO|nr:hypothetical protein N7492_009292 [Penicillium capsulatum]KAJ6106686.1 hypothetical protein N7512_010203 [Penicillium capsulatum]